MRTETTTRTFEQMTADERWLGFGYLQGRMYADAAEVELADTFVYDVTADWTDEQLFAWANSKDGRWFADVLFGGNWTDADLDMAGRYVRKQGDTMSTPTYHEPTFRTYPPETVRDSDGRMVTMTLCEDLVDGRWEPFYSFGR